jgi:ADP-ribosylglycohydrolase
MSPGRHTAARNSLEGLSVGDAFGECFFSIVTNPLSLRMHLETRTLPNQRWRWTDDTAMAVSIVELLLRRGFIDQDELAQSFASRYAQDDRRGYGATAYGILTRIGQGIPWREASQNVMDGTGSMGNGGAMRVAPLGAYFATDTTRVIEQARLSAEVTHAHPEGQAGAIATALAASFVGRLTGPDFDRAAFFNFVLDNTPDSLTRARIAQAGDLPPDYSVETATSVVGNGSSITAPETVPFCLWCVARHPRDFEEAMWTTVSGGGDMDTNCAIVAGILCANELCVPPFDWWARREPLPPLDYD